MFQNSLFTLLLSLVVAASLAFFLPLQSVQAGISDQPVGGSSGITNPLGEGGSQTITDVLKKVINWMLGLVGFLALIALIIGGARMIMDFGNEEQVKKAKMTITWAVIGLLVVMLSYAIINIVVSDVLGGGQTKSVQQQYDGN